MGQLFNSRPLEKFIDSGINFRYINNKLYIPEYRHKCRKEISKNYHC